ncbi:hypothetical protein [Thermococcus sp.]|uniref:hypothetical protein n=1 Tax=Thermococcus sp. TaxID=35749 RepID=UPI002622E5E5|nr:hypothetical protein [Thermococcus sp.]
MLRARILKGCGGRRWASFSSQLLPKKSATERPAFLKKKAVPVLLFGTGLVNFVVDVSDFLQSHFSIVFIWKQGSSQPETGNGETNDPAGDCFPR